MQKLNFSPIVAIVKPTKKCNLKCRYCYETHEHSFMDDYTLERIISEVTNYNASICKTNSFDKTISSYIWHGGEPLLLGIKFFQKVKFLQKKYANNDHIIQNAIQTNMTLLTKEYWDYFNKSGFHLGSSLDGNREMNNNTRIFRNGKGAFDKIMHSINMTRKSHTSKSPIGCILVLTKDKLNKMEEIYNFFKENNISFEVNFPSIIGSAEKNSSTIEVTPEEWAEAMIELFSIWYHDDKVPFIDIPFLSKISAGVLTGRINYCTFGGTCRDRYISINPDGSVYPCGKFGSHDEFKLGNIKNQSIFEILSSETNKYLLSRNVNNIESCRSCDYKNVCNAGCFYNAYAMSGDPLAKDPLCRAYKMLFNHMGKILRTELEKAETGITEQTESSMVVT